MANHNPGHFAVLLKHYRTMAPLTQEQLAARAQLSTDAIRALERGRRRIPRPDSARLLADALSLAGEDRAAFLVAAVAPGDALPVDQASAPGQRILFGLAAPTQLIGREHELERIRQRLSGTVGADNPLGERVRLLTLTGPAGVGKTCLALAAAGQLADAYPGGIVQIDLAPVRDPSLVLPTIARALDVAESGTALLRDRVRDFLRERTALLVLDNFEQVLPAARVLGALLADCPELTFLVTSRLPLRLRLERQLQVPTLAVPDLSATLPPADVLAQIPAVALFLERARARRDTFDLTESQASLVAHLVVELDGLPLALELAAARLGTLSLPTIARRLADRLRLLRWAAPDAPERHHSLEAAVGWSYDLLSPQEQRLFRCLGVFAGRVSLDAITAIAHAVSGPSGGSGTYTTGAADAGQTLEGLLALAEHSLILPVRHPAALAWEPQEDPDMDDVEGSDVPAFRLLETVRAYAEERLAAAGEQTAAHRAHARYFRSLAERADPQLRGPGQRAWYLRLEREHDNLRTALRWLLDQEDPTERAGGLWLAGTLGWFWWRRGYHEEGRRWLAEALARAPQAETAGGARVDLAARVRALLAAGPLLTLQPDFERARTVLAEALALAERQHDRVGVAWAHTYQGRVAVVAGEIAAGTRRLREALLNWEMLGDPHGQGWALLYLGSAADATGDYAAAAADYAAALDRLGAAGDARLAGFVHSHLGVAKWRSGELASAAEHIQAAVRTSVSLRDRFLLSIAAQATAVLIGAYAEPTERARLLGAEDALAQATGATRMWEHLPGGPDITALRERLAHGEDEWVVAYREGRSLSFGTVAALACHLLNQFAQALPRHTAASDGAPFPDPFRVQ